MLAEKILLDPSVVFGAGATSCFVKLAETFGRPDLARKRPDWHQQFEIRGGKDVERLLPKSLKVGTVILEFTDEGRIDRYEVCDTGGAVCYYSPEYSVLYSCLGFSAHMIGKQATMSEFENPGRSSRSIGPLCRIVVIKPVSG